ncbi:MAG: Na-translocating system protein MpsC family protein, partial [Pirellulales bacterium]
THCPCANIVCRIGRLAHAGDLSQNPQPRSISLLQIHWNGPYLGWRAEQIRVHFIKDLLVVRLQGVLTVAERQLAKSLSPERGRDLIKQTREHLLELARPMLESMVHEVVGVKVLTMHHDISTVTGEEVILFSLTEAPRFS